MAQRKKEKPEMYQNEEFRLKVLSLPVDEGACGWMRIRAPFKEMAKQKLADTAIIELKQISEENLKKALVIADVIVVRPGGEKLMMEAKKMYPFKKYIADFDDDVFNINPSSGHYKDYGTNDVDVELPDGSMKPLWRSGLGGFDKWSNRHRTIDVQWLLEEADMVTAVTKRLGSYLSSRANDRLVHYVPNAIDFNLYPDVEVEDPNKKGEFRIGFCGGMSHAGDLEIIREDLIKWIKKDKKRVLYMIGHKFERFEELGKQVRFEPWVAFQANPYRMKLLDLDMLIAPLSDTEFNIRKDPLKFWDAGALALPLFASNIPPFSDVMEDGATGYLFDDSKEFIKKLNRLEKKRDTLKKVGRAAREFVHTKRNLADLAPQLAELYAKLSREPKDARYKK